jgi:hypothetical protein
MNGFAPAEEMGSRCTSAVEGWTCDWGWWKIHQASTTSDKHCPDETAARQGESSRHWPLGFDVVETQPPATPLLLLLVTGRFFFGHDCSPSGFEERMRGNRRLHATASLSQRQYMEERGGYRLNTPISYRLGEQWELRPLCPHEPGGLTPVASITTFDEIFRHYSPCLWSLLVVFMFALIPVIGGTLPGDVIWVRHGL